RVLHGPAPGGEDGKEALAAGRPQRRPSPEPDLPPPGPARPPCEVLGDLAPHIPARDLASPPGPLLHWTPVPAQPDPPPGRSRDGEAHPPRPGLGTRRDLRLGTTLAARALRRRGLLPNRPPRFVEARDPPGARGTGGGPLGRPAGGADARLRALDGGALRPGRAAPGG